MLTVAYEMIGLNMRTDTDVSSVMMFTKNPFHLALRCSTSNINQTSDASRGKDDNEVDVTGSFLLYLFEWIFCSSHIHLLHSKDYSPLAGKSRKKKKKKFPECFLKSFCTWENLDAFFLNHNLHQIFIQVISYGNAVRISESVEAPSA